MCMYIYKADLFHVTYHYQSVKKELVAHDKELKAKTYLECPGQHGLYHYYLKIIFVWKGE